MITCSRQKVPGAKKNLRSLERKAPFGLFINPDVAGYLVGTALFQRRSARESRSWSQLIKPMHSLPTSGSRAVEDYPEDGFQANGSLFRRKHFRHAISSRYPSGMPARNGIAKPAKPKRRSAP
jgi:hypothetical protein